MFNRSLSLAGRPINLRSFFLLLRREFFKEVDFVKALETGQEVSFPARFIREWGVIKGVVAQVNLFQDGKLVVLVPSPKSLFENWQSVRIWINNDGPAGVLQHQRF